MKQISKNSYQGYGQKGEESYQMHFGQGGNGPCKDGAASLV